MNDEKDLAFEELSVLAKRDYQAEIVSTTRFHINNVAFCKSGKIYVTRLDRKGRFEDIPVSTRPRTNIQMRLVMNYIFNKTEQL